MRKKLIKYFLISFSMILGIAICNAQEVNLEGLGKGSKKP